MAKTKILRKFTENFPTIFQKIIFHEISPKSIFPRFSVDIQETILVNVPFQFCLAAQSIGQDGAILPDDQPIKLRESRAG